MKKALVIVLALVLCLSVVLVACDKKGGDDTTASAPASELARAKQAVEVLNKDKIPAKATANFELSKTVVLDGGVYSYPITWTSDNESVKVVSADDQNVRVEIPDQVDEEFTYTLTATITADDNTKETVQFNRAVAKSIPMPALGEHRFVLEQANKGAWYFANGTVNSSDYLATTTKPAEAAIVVLAEAEGGYTLTVDGKFIEVYEKEQEKDGKTEYKVRVRIAETQSGVWSWNKELGVFTWTIENKTHGNNGTYYLGTYNNYDTMSASKISYISGANAANVGKSQFPAYLVAKDFVPAEKTDEEKVADAKGKLTVPTTASGDLNLLTTLDGVTITWASSNTAVIANDGTVTQGTEDVEVTLTATLKLNDATDTKDFTVTVQRKNENALVLTVDNLALKSQQYAAGIADVGGVTFVYTELGNYGDGIQCRINKSDNSKFSSIANTVALSKPIAKIIITLSSTKEVKYSNKDVFSFKFGDSSEALAHEVMLSTEAGTYQYEITPDAATYTYFSMTQNVNVKYTFYIASITIVFAE